MDRGLLWLAVHGSTIGTTLFVSLVIGGFLLWPGVKRVLIRLRSRRLRAGLGEPLTEGLTSHIDEVVTLTGRLGAGGKAIEAVEGIEELRGASAATLEMSPTLASSRPRADELWVEVGDDRVDLDGQVDVVVGAQELYPPHGGSGLSPFSEKPVLFPQLVVARWIDDGQKVRVRGTLERVPTGSGDTTYRSAAPSRLSLKPERAGKPSPSLLMTSERVPRVIGSPWSFTSIWVALGVGGSSVFVSAMLLWLVGSAAMGVAWRERSYTAAAVASATPLARRQALNWMTDSLEDRLEEGELAIGPYITLCRLQQRQYGAFRMLMEIEQYEHAASIAHEIGNTEGLRLAAQRMARRGQFDRASSWFESARQLTNQPHAAGWREEVLTHLLAGRLEPAAALTALEARNDNGHRQCIAEAIAARAGDEQAFGRLIERAALSPELAECQLLRADAVPPEARIAALEQCRECSLNSRWARVMWLLYYEALLATGAEAPERAHVAEEATFYVTSSFLEPGASNVHLHVPGLEQHLLRELGSLEPASLADEERRFLERLAHSVGVVDQLMRPTASMTIPAPSREDPWISLWPDPLWTMAGISAHLRNHEERCDSQENVVEETLQGYHEGLSRRETAVLIDVFAAW